MVLTDPHIREARRIESDQLDLPPDTAGDEARSPVPTEVAGLFAQPAGALQTLHLEPAGQAIRLLTLAHLLGCRSEADLDAVLPHRELSLDVELPGAVHVVGPCHQLAVDADGGQGVESVTTQQHPVGFEQGGTDPEVPPIAPVRLADPLQVFLVLAEERIFDRPQGQEIGVYAAGDGGRLTASGSNSAELPAAAETQPLRLPAAGCGSVDRRERRQVRSSFQRAGPACRGLRRWSPPRPARPAGSPGSSSLPPTPRFA